MGPLDGVRVVELSHEHVAFAGKLLAELGAEVTVVEPPGGSPQRGYPPFLDDDPGPERSLWWWHYHTGKRSVVLDPAAAGDADRLDVLVASADIVLVGEDAGVAWENLHAAHPRVLMVSITPFGLGSPRAGEAVTDLTILAEAGPAWSCGYDDHTTPPVRGAGNQASHTAGNWAVLAVLAALIHRDHGGPGQLIEVSMLEASNVTTELATYGWLQAGIEVQRQTGRHAAPVLTPPTQVRCRDGRYATTGVPPRDPATFGALVGLLDRRGLRERFEGTAVLELGAELSEPINLGALEHDPLAADIITTARDAIWFLAEQLDAHDFFLETQRIGIATGAVLTPGEATMDPHFVERGFPVEIEHEDLGRTITYPGPPYQFREAPLQVRRPPRLGEHHDIFGS